MPVPHHHTANDVCAFNDVICWFSLDFSDEALFVTSDFTFLTELFFNLTWKFLCSNGCEHIIPDTKESSGLVNLNFFSVQGHVLHKEKKNIDTNLLLSWSSFYGHPNTKENQDSMVFEIQKWFQIHVHASTIRMDQEINQGRWCVVTWGRMRIPLHIIFFRFANNKFYSEVEGS